MDFWWFHGVEDEEEKVVAKWWFGLKAKVWLQVGLTAKKVYCSVLHVKEKKWARFRGLYGKKSGRGVREVKLGGPKSIALSLSNSVKQQLHSS